MRISFTREKFFTDSSARVAGVRSKLSSISELIARHDKASVQHFSTSLELTIIRLIKIESFWVMMIASDRIFPFGNRIIEF